jgi:hypothetical protein
LWLEGNLELPTLVKDMTNPEEEDYRTKVIKFIDGVFTECLDESSGRDIQKTHKVTDEDTDLIHDPTYLDQAFEEEANFVAYCCQIHSHSATCSSLFGPNGVTSQSSTTQKKLETLAVFNSSYMKERRQI